MSDSKLADGSNPLACDESRGLAARFKEHAVSLGFDAVGIAPAVAPPGYASFRRWLEKGHAAEMDYLERHAEARAHPDSILEGVRSIVVAAFVYGQPDEEPLDPCQGRVARYARGGDYHKLLWKRLDALLDWLKTERPEARGRAVADTAPLLERDMARLAGLGWIGKNTMLIHKKLGTYTLLGALLVDIELEPDPPHVSSHCGTCTRCLDACPTGAFVGPYELDSRKCISYWTIEQRGPLDDEAANHLDGWVFGCDVCQEVCPWNRKAPTVREPTLEPRPEWTNPDLVEWLEAEPEEFQRRLRSTALKRAKRAGLLRNAAHVLGSQGETRAVPALAARLLQDADPVIRSAAAWALGAIGGEQAVAALGQAENDPDPEVRQAVLQARKRVGRDSSSRSSPQS